MASRLFPCFLAADYLGTWTSVILASMDVAFILLTVGWPVMPRPGPAEVVCEPPLDWSLFLDCRSRGFSTIYYDAARG